MTDVKVEQCQPAVCGFLKATEADRQAAASGYFAWMSGNPVIPKRILSGEADDHSLVQAFARHRQAAEKAQQERDAGVCEKVVADWQEKTKLYRSRGNNGPYLGEPTGWSIATAIRSQGHE